MTSVKLVFLGLPRIKVFWNNSYDVLKFVHDVTKKTFSRGSNCIIDMVMWPKFGNFSISMTEVMTNSIYKDFTGKTNFFEGCSWFKFNNLGLALAMALKFYTSVAKGLKLKVRKFWGLISTFVEVCRWKTGRGAFYPPSWIWLMLWMNASSVFLFPSFRYCFYYKIRPWVVSFNWF